MTRAPEAPQWTTRQVFSAGPPVLPVAAAPPRIGTLLNLAPGQAWVHFCCRKVYQPDAEPGDACTVRLQCGQLDGASVA